MHALIADFAVAKVPEPVPVVMDQIGVIRLLRCRTQPDVEIELLGRSLGRFEADAPRGLKLTPRETCSLPNLPDWIAAAAKAQSRLERLWVPCCTIRLYRRAASTAIRPSCTLWLHGFSTYTSLPAWQLQIVINACQ